MPRSETCGYWIERFKADFFDRGGTETTWSTEYWKILKQLPTDKPMTRDRLHALVISTEVHTRTRVRAVMVCGKIAQFAGIKYDPKPYKGKYSPRDVDPRDIPTDEAIVEQFTKLTNPGWRWVFGVLATYGLRPHEAFRLDLATLGTGDAVLHVERNTKTGSRQVWAFHPEWVQQFDLLHPVLPPINLDRTNTRVGESASRYFGEWGLPFHLYDMRHRWAIRSLEYGLDPGLAAKQMGHSRIVHEQIYHRWIDRTVHQRAYDSLLRRSDRPQPPTP